MKKELTDKNIIQFANMLSELDLQKSTEMFLDCIKQYGADYTVKITRLAELYKRTKAGQVDRAEAVGLQADILNLEVTNA